MLEVVLRETIEEDLQVSSAGGYGLPEGGSSKLLHELGSVLDSGESSQQLLLRVESHLLDRYSFFSWLIKVERWDGTVYSIRFDRTSSERTTSEHIVEPEPVVVRRSRYSREPVI